MAYGFVVRIGGPFAPFEDWYVALADPDGAMQAAHDAAGPLAQYKNVQIIGEFSAAEVDQLGLLPGQLKQKGMIRTRSWT